MPGKQVKNWDMYHKLRAKGHTKESAAKITNAAHSKRRRLKRKVTR